MVIEQLPLFTPPAAEAPAPPAPPPDSPPNARYALRPTTPLTIAIDAWRAYMEKESAENDKFSLHTIKAFGYDLGLLAQYRRDHKKDTHAIGELTTADLHEWLQSLNCTPKSYARRVTSLKSFFRWLTQTNALSHDPAAPLIQQSVLSPLPEFLTRAEVEQALQAAQALQQSEKPDVRPLVLFSLLLQTGIKKNECLNLRPHHVDLANPDEPVLWIRFEEQKDPKHHYKERKLLLDKSWLPAYRAYLAQYEPRDKLFPWSPRRLEYLLEDITKAAGLKKHISFEMCRWTCAVRAAQAGTDYNTIRQRLGLSKIQWREIGMKLEKLVALGV